ncbi:MAG: PorT family protein [Mediterranea sp.]|jgi:hypothetical protein|nr:PorT family protein [Mediterranea sp.]
MKNRIIIFIIFLLSLPCALHAQWGVKVGTGLSSMDFGKFKPVVSMQVGGTVEAQLSRKWFLIPELLLVYNGSDQKDDGWSIRDGQLRFLSLELPVNLSFRPKLSATTNLLVEGGVYFRYALWGHQKIHYYDSSFDEDGSTFDSFDRYDHGIQLGFGLQVRKYYGLLLFQTETVFGDGARVYHRAIRLNFGYRF